MIVLTVWSIVLDAPLEEPANPSRTPNPSKAPWYFLGLQEMLVYFDPWIAGVVLPTIIIVGLMAIPYIDKNPKGNGYYTFQERKFAITTFLFGFLVLWLSLIVLGTFLRGPGWNFFAPWELWDPHKVVAMVNVDLHEALGIRSKLGAGIFGAVLIGAYFSLGFIYYFMKEGQKRIYQAARRGALRRRGISVSDHDGPADQNDFAHRFQHQIHLGYALVQRVRRLTCLNDLRFLWKNATIAISIFS
jgi:hypothetical protein